MSDKQDKSYTVLFTRIELTWLMRQLIAGMDKAHGIIKTYSGDLITVAKKSEEQQQQLDEANKYVNVFSGLIQSMKDMLTAGDKGVVQRERIREELAEVIELCDSETAKKAAQEKLDNLKISEEFRIAFDRGTIKFTLKLLENDLHKFRTHVIPSYEKTDPKEFTDALYTKAYHVNKARKSKGILEQLKIKLEKKL